MKMSRKAEYALMIIKEMSSAPKRQLFTTPELHKNLQIPPDTVAKILQAFTRHEILESFQGIHGGYRLLSSWEQLSFMKLCEIVEGEQGIVSCIKESTSCNLKDSCTILTPVKKLNEKVLKFFDSVFLKDLIHE